MVLAFLSFLTNDRRLKLFALRECIGSSRAPGAALLSTGGLFMTNFRGRELNVLGGVLSQLFNLLALKLPFF